MSPLKAHLSLVVDMIICSTWKWENSHVENLGSISSTNVKWLWHSGDGYYVLHSTVMC